MKVRRLIALLAVCLTLAFAVVGCGTSGTSGHHHALLKSVAGAVVIHHLVKKHGGKHALAKAVIGGAVIHHVVTHHKH
jgi:hypothetical protein